MLTGSIVAIVTPMTESGEIDWSSFCSLIDWHIEEGTDAIVVAGTTGESSTLSVSEHIQLIARAVDHAQGRIPIIAGTGANSTHEATRLNREVENIGVDAVLSVVPYYNKPTQAGLYQHFSQVAQQTSLPVILYNVPSRTITDLHNDTVLALSEIPNIIGIKDACGHIGRTSDLLRQLKGKDFSVYSGDDESAVATMLLGGSGTISVTANVAPRLMHNMCKAAIQGDLTMARALHYRLLKLHRNLFVEANPIPVKWALAEMGMIPKFLRLPLTPLSNDYHSQIRDALQEAGCI